MMDSNGKGFQSALPLRGATAGLRRDLLDSRISIRAPLAGSDRRLHGQLPRRDGISIRAPLAGSDEHRHQHARRHDEISIRAPLAGSDAGDAVHTRAELYFNPRSTRRGISTADFNPRSPCGERHGTGKSINFTTDFNPRSPCGERPSETPAMFIFYLFQSALPLRGATRHARREDCCKSISIRAPLAGSDRTWFRIRTH